MITSVSPVYNKQHGGEQVLLLLLVSMGVAVGKVQLVQAAVGLPSKMSSTRWMTSPSSSVISLIVTPPKRSHRSCSNQSSTEHTRLLTPHYSTPGMLERVAWKGPHTLSRPSMVSPSRTTTRCVRCS